MRLRARCCGTYGAERDFQDRIEFRDFAFLFLGDYPIR
jgi:hypothetical protein